jgi:hypothetical protein
MNRARRSPSSTLLDQQAVARTHGDPDRLYIEQRLLRGHYAKEIASDLWRQLRRTLDNPSHPSDDCRAAQLTRQLSYLCQNYQVEDKE